MFAEGEKQAVALDRVKARILGLCCGQGKTPSEAADLCGLSFGELVEWAKEDKDLQIVFRAQQTEEAVDAQLQKMSVPQRLSAAEITAGFSHAIMIDAGLQEAITMVIKNAKDNLMSEDPKLRAQGTRDIKDLVAKGLLKNVLVKMTATRNENVNHKPDDMDGMSLEHLCRLDDELGSRIEEAKAKAESNRKFLETKAMQDVAIEADFEEQDCGETEDLGEVRAEHSPDDDAE